jgi:hypothetical protein
MNRTASSTFPLAALTIIGILLVVLGLFVAAEIGLVVLGLTSLAVAALLGAVAARRE